MKYFLCKHLHSRRSGGRMESKMRTYLQINPKDNVAVALAPLSSGTAIELDRIFPYSCRGHPPGTQICPENRSRRTDRSSNTAVPSAIAKEDILPGHWVHIHNIKTGLGDLLTYTYDRKVTEPRPLGRAVPSRATGGRTERQPCATSFGSSLPWGASIILPQPSNGRHSPSSLARSKLSLHFPHPYGCSQMGDGPGAHPPVLADHDQSSQRGRCTRPGTGLRKQQY